jgi:hypothetical protein
LQGKVRDGQAVLVDYDPDKEELTFRPQEASSAAGAR